MADDARADEITRPEAKEVIRLWPDGPPTKGKDLAETSYLQPALDGSQIAILRNVSEPTITVFRPTAQANGVGVIVAPGGGWRILAIEHEGVTLAEWLAARGYTAFLLKYRVAATPPDPAEFAAAMERVSRPLAEPRPASKAPKAIEEILRDDSTAFGRKLSIEDGRRALTLVRERAADWGVDPDKVGMIGFSAGAFPRLVGSRPARRVAHLPAWRPRLRHGQAGRAGRRLGRLVRRLAEGPRVLTVWLGSPTLHHGRARPGHP